MHLTQHTNARKFVRQTGLLLLIVLCACTLLVAQEVTGSITGVVTDPTGSSIPGAAVSVLPEGRTTPIEVTTDATGAYTVPQLAVGKYTVAAQATGFSQIRKTEVLVIIGRATRLDFKLEVGQVSESVVVSADAIMIDTASSSSAINVDKSFFDLMPKGRSFYDLVSLAPGARDESKTGGYQVDGASGAENTYYVDGMEVTNIQTGVLNDQSKIPVEMVQQVQVKNGVMDAEYGGAMGGVVSAVVRSGTNDFHGQAGFYYNNDNMQARPRPTLEMDPTDDTRLNARYFQNSLDDYSTWNPIVTVGGPIIKNKLFFFAGYMPTLTTYNRTVTFLSNDQTGTFTQKNRQQYLVGKLNFVPTNKLRMDMSWIWNPYYERGQRPAWQGTDSPDRNWGGLGNYTAGNTISGKIDYLATNRLIFSFRGGYYFYNNTNRYALSDATYVYSTSNLMFPDLSPDLQLGSTGWVQQGTPRQDFNIYKRVGLNADGSYLLDFGGQHNLKFGWQTNRLSNSVQNLTYPNGYYRFYWDQSYTCVTSQCSGKQRGTYGYYRWYTYGDFGDASSDNQGIFVQDSWRVNSRLTLNLGLRTEREFLPSFQKGDIAAAPPIEFSWGSKISPRLGFAWDPTGSGKMRLYSSFGYFYDIMKYEMPRGSFGGAIYLTYYYALDDPSLLNTMKTYGYPSDPKALPGRFFEGVDWRIPANDPNNNTVDPNLKPMKQRMLDIGYDYSFSTDFVGSVRYTNRRLIRTIEDIGTLGPAGEVYYIGNPGYGLVADPNTWGPGYPTTPKARRDYDAVEFRVDKRFSRHYQFAASYTWSRSFGNYSGLASTDENGRTSPNVERYFDLPWIGLTEQGVMAEGPLATDRPHTFKFFGAYQLESFLGSTTLSPNIQWYSGIPITTELNAISSVPVYPYGRGDLGRTPFFQNYDMNLIQDFKPLKGHENMKFRFEFTVFNLLNQSTVTNINSGYLHPDDGQLQFDPETSIFNGYNMKQLVADQGGRVSPLYGLPNEFQGPRRLRFQLSFFF